VRPQDNPKQLLVEGVEDLHSVCGIMRAHIAWSAEPKEYPVYITAGGGAAEILAARLIALKLKERFTRILGVMLDADEKPKNRYGHIRSQCLPDFPNMPDDLSSEGLVLENGSGKRIGVWIMPDNITSGSLELFLRHMVPAESAHIWNHAINSTASAKRLGAPYHDSHCDKANLYTWLAWQNEPAQRAGEALAKKILDPHSLSAAAFVKWFKDLYQL
jgi:hypothetical protein